MIEPLREWVEEQKQEVTAASMRLIEEDAPKNKFSILTGKMRMLEELAGWIERFELSRKSQG